MFQGDEEIPSSCNIQLEANRFGVVWNLGRSTDFKEIIHARRIPKANPAGTILTWWECIADPYCRPEP